ncbi:MAG TPA: multicopper oxidase family protein, partial [Gammaproteobacteria bacterium]|nr:multicopper oxidase family protein [Gammaproteobacteria bacterium]
GDMDKPLIRVKRGETVRIDITNDTSFPHAMHLHGTHFKVIARNNMSYNNGEWRDTELVFPDEKVSFAFLADNPGKWLFHCHMIEHQAGGMVTWIDVV